MTNQLSMLLKKYSIPLVFFIMGLLMLVMGVSKNQDSMFMVAAVMMFIAGILSILYSTGKIKPSILYVIGLAAGIAGLFTIYMSWKSVEITNTYNKNYDYCKSLATQNLEDVRFIQKAYAEMNGVYLKDWNALVDFTKNGTIAIPDAQGNVPGRRITVEENNYLYTGNPPIDKDMSEDEAYRLSKWTEGPNWQADFASFRRDTIQISILENKFKNKAYVKSRENAGFYRFSADSLSYIPFTNAKMKWTMETRDSVKTADLSVPAIKVYGKIPFAKIKGKDNDTEEMYFGTLSSGDTDGSWEED